MIAEQPVLKRAWCAPSKATFEIKPIYELLGRVLRNSFHIVDPFARGSDWGHMTNDIDPETSAEFHMDATEFAHWLSDRYIADAILFDPPYSLEQAKRSYQKAGLHFGHLQTWDVNRWTKCKDILTNILEPGGVAISFGWNSCGFGLKRGFVLEEILMVCHGAGHHDTIVTVERKTQNLEEGK